VDQEDTDSLTLVETKMARFVQFVVNAKSRR